MNAEPLGDELNQDPQTLVVAHSKVRSSKNKFLLIVIIPLVVTLVALLLFTYSWFGNHKKLAGKNTQNAIQVSKLDTSKLPGLAAIDTNFGSQVTINGNLVANGSISLKPSLQPTIPKQGEIYFDQNTQKLYVYQNTGYTTFVTAKPDQLVCYKGETCDASTIKLPSASNGLQSTGTGAESYTKNAVLLGNGSSLLTTTNSPLSGQLLIVNSAGVPTFTSLSGDIDVAAGGQVTLKDSSVGPNQLASTAVIAGTYGSVTNFPVITVDSDGRIISASTLPIGAASSGIGSLNSLIGAVDIIGTVNQISVTVVGSTITLSTPQSIAVSSSPSFNGLTVSGAGGITVGSAGSNGVVVLRDGSTSFTQSVQPAALSANRSVSLPDASGTFAVSASGNISLSSTGNISLSGQIPVANGGTGFGTTQSAINNLSQLTVNGDLLYYNGTNSTRLPRGANGECLTSNANTVVWVTCGTAAGTGGSANTSLSNLSSVAINSSLLTGTANIDLGSNIVFEGATANAFETTITLVDPTVDNVITFPDATGTVCLTSGNCAGIGGTGDVINNGQLGTVRLGSNNANSVFLETNNVDRLTIDNAGAATFSGTVAAASFS